jgi:hypothetical protein
MLLNLWQNNDNVSTYFDSIVSKLGNISSLLRNRKSRRSLVLPGNNEYFIYYWKHKCKLQIDSKLEKIN